MPIYEPVFFAPFAASDGRFSVCGFPALVSLVFLCASSSSDEMSITSMDTVKSTFVSTIRVILQNSDDENTWFLCSFIHRHRLQRRMNNVCCLTTQNSHFHVPFATFFSFLLFSSVSFAFAARFAGGSAVSIVNF